ncbi:hypothetical protein B0H10DRAFT_3720 [Mycena sp. CBHHK59/15]|nr:hypothetical protein B0H10DRAFT_3720 [Mycena sp. CBHHK59/15]
MWRGGALCDVGWRGLVRRRGDAGQRYVLFALSRSFLLSLFLPHLRPCACAHMPPAGYPRARTSALAPRQARSVVRDTELTTCGISTALRTPPVPTTSRIAGPSTDTGGSMREAFRVCGVVPVVSPACDIHYAASTTRGAAIVQAPSSRLPVLAVHRAGQLVYVSIILVCAPPANTRPFAPSHPVLPWHSNLSPRSRIRPSFVICPCVATFLSQASSPHPCIHASVRCATLLMMASSRVHASVLASDPRVHRYARKC